MPPPNDTRATSQAIPVGSYSGTLSGTTVDATEDAGGPVDGFGARDVFYHWASIDAGAMFLYVKPKAGFTSVYFEVAVMSGLAPVDWTSADTWTAFGYYFDSGLPADRCRIGFYHSGGPCSVCVYTYDPDETSFLLGWGHELDPNDAHWGDPQTDDYATDTGGGGFSTPTFATRWGAVEFSTTVAGTSVPAGDPGCAWDSARQGAVTGSPMTACTDLGPGVGVTSTADDAQDIGAHYLATDTGYTPPAPPENTRSDLVEVGQKVHAVRFPTGHRGAVTENDAEPAGFDDYQDANQGATYDLVWGWSFDGVHTWDTANYTMGVVTIDDDWDGTPFTADENGDCTPRFYALPQSMIWGDSGTVEDEPDRVFITEASAGGNSYITPVDIPGDELVALVDLSANDLTIADGPTAESFMLTSADGTDARWLVGVFIAQETIDDVPPPFPDPAFEGQARGDAGRSLTFTGAPSFDWRVPTWRPYIGFPLMEGVSGWHVGRIGMGGNW